MTSRILYVTALLLGCCCLSLQARPTKDFGAYRLKGGVLQPLDLTMVEASNEHINFCFAHNFSDGSIYMGHSKGIHTVTEYGHCDVSYDNGRTWQEIPFNLGFNAYEKKDGTKACVACWDGAFTTEHEIRNSVLAPDGKSLITTKSTITLDRPSTFRLHRDVVRCKSGRLLVTGYGMWKDDSQLHSFLVGSDDDGETWTYLSTIMADPERAYTEGPNESAVMELANGDLLAVTRVNPMIGMFQLRSTDGGKSWVNEGQVATYAAAPSLHMMQDGTLLIISGRPGVNLLVDFTGTGRDWQEVPIFSGSGSSYASVLETEPGILSIIYDESDFGGWRGQSMFSRLLCCRYSLTRSEAAEETDSEKSGWDAYYDPSTEKQPSELGIAISKYNKKEECAAAYYEFIETEMRSHKLLRLHNIGENFTEKFLNYFMPMGRGAKGFSIRTECRLVDNSQNGPQLGIIGAVDDFTKGGTDNPALYAWIGIQKDAILYVEADGKEKRFDYPIGLTFHEVRLTASGEDGIAEVYVDDISKPLFTFKMPSHKQIRPKVQIGDGATNVFGVCDIVNFAWSFRKMNFTEEAE